MRTTEFSPCRKYRYTLWREWNLDSDLISRGAGACRAASDGDCGWTECPQFRDGEPEKSGRHCILDNNGGYLMVIGLNPSTADETKDDPTIRRCIDFAKRWGYGALCMTNLFAWRDTKPENMRRAPDPIGVMNDSHLALIADGAGLILAAWGKHGAFNDRDNRVLRMMRELHRAVHCLRRNKDGSPMHPLYVSAETVPIRYA